MAKGRLIPSALQAQIRLATPMGRFPHDGKVITYIFIDGQTGVNIYHMRVNK